MIHVQLVGILADGLPCAGPTMWVRVPATTSRAEVLANGPKRLHGVNVGRWVIGNTVDDYGNCVPVPQCMWAS